MLLWPARGEADEGDADQEVLDGSPSHIQGSKWSPFSDQLSISSSTHNEQLSPAGSPCSAFACAWTICSFSSHCCWISLGGITHTLVVVACVTLCLLQVREYLPPTPSYPPAPALGYPPATQYPNPPQYSAAMQYPTTPQYPQALQYSPASTNPPLPYSETNQNWSHPPPDYKH